MKCVTEESGGCFKCILDKCVNGAGTVGVTSFTTTTDRVSQVIYTMETEPETEPETVKDRKLQKVFIILCRSAAPIKRLWRT